MKTITIEKDNLPAVIQTELSGEDIQTIIRERIRAELKGLIKEAILDVIGETKLKEVEQEKQQALKEKARKEEVRKWKEEFDARMREEQFNPTINASEAAKILGVHRQTVANWAKKGKLIGEYDRGMGWFFKTNQVKAFKELLPDMLRKRTLKPEIQENRTKAINWLKDLHNQGICLYYFNIKKQYPELIRLIKKYFDCYQDAIRKAGFRYSQIRLEWGELVKQQAKVRKERLKCQRQEDILQDIKSLYKQGVNLSYVNMVNNYCSVLARGRSHYGNWPNAVKAAGLDYSKVCIRQRKTKEELCLTSV